ncbi:hypothetical protein [Streptomyces sp. NPDC055287]
MELWLPRTSRIGVLREVHGRLDGFTTLVIERHRRRRRRGQRRE